MLVALFEIWLYHTENFEWRNSGPYPIGHNQQQHILSVVVISGPAVLTSRTTTLGLYQRNKYIWNFDINLFIRT